tara:strand:+ start:284 stop:1378 length:1095 start_codon:yes stop_codon:yes gene_type:complete
MQNEENNLRKFLKSDDPALVKMGLSMAAGIEFSEEILAELLWLSTFHTNNESRKLVVSSLSKLVRKRYKILKKDFIAVENLFNLMIHYKDKSEGQYESKTYWTSLWPHKFQTVWTSLEICDPKYHGTDEELLLTHTIKSVQEGNNSPVFFIRILKKISEELNLNAEFADKLDECFNEIVERIELHNLPAAESMIGNYENYDHWYRGHVDDCMEFARGGDQWFEGERTSEDYMDAEEYLYNSDSYLMGFEEWNDRFKDWTATILILGQIGTLQSIRILRNITLPKSSSEGYPYWQSSGHDSGLYCVPGDAQEAFCISLNTSIKNLSRKDKKAERLERVEENNSIKYPLSEAAFINLLDKNSKVEK